MNTEEKPLVLVAEDREYYFNIISASFGDKACLQWCNTLESAEKYFLEHLGDISAVIMDACVNKETEQDSAPLVRKMRERDFKGPIIACSGASDFRKQLMDAGADWEAWKDTAAAVTLRAMGMNT